MVKFFALGTMRTYAFRWFFFAISLLLMGIPLLGQAGLEGTSQRDARDKPTHLGYPQDWSSRHLLMPGGRAEDVLAAGDHDPRYVYNIVMRQVAVENLRKEKEKEAEESPIGIFGPSPSHRIPWRIPRHKMKIDWAVSLENGHVPRNQFPAKYQFDVTGEN